MRKYSFLKIICPLCIIICAIFFQVSLVKAQNPTCTNLNSPPVPYRGWTKNATVQVYISPNISGRRRSAVTNAFNNWQQNSTANCSNITYQFVNSVPPIGTGFTVLNQQYPTDTSRAVTDVITNDTTGDTMSATTYLAPTVTDPDAVLETIAHEIGHPMGLGHCDTCAPSASTMATRDQYT